VWLKKIPFMPNSKKSRTGETKNIEVCNIFLDWELAKPQIKRQKSKKVAFICSSQVEL
jgi:hypothetical protein